VILALLAAFGSAICYGVASALQAVAARRATPSAGRVDPRLLVRVLRQAPFVAGMVLDVLGFGLQFVALRRLPLFVVQAAQSGNLAVTAVVAVPLLKMRLAARQWAAVGAVTGGLAMLALSAGTENPRPAGLGFRIGLLVVVAGLVLAGLVAARLAGPARSLGLGLVAGLGFGVAALAVRSLGSMSVAHLVRDPALYALLAGGGAAFLFFTTGLQRGSVTVVIATLVVAETAVPALIGILVFGDRTRPGYVPVAAIGFLLAVAGAVALARFGEPAAEPAEPAAEPALAPTTGEPAEKTRTAHR
jgi:drug/metabolite transporter (DMT)-like permease